MHSFHQKNLFCTQTFDGEKIKKDKGRTSCFCISQSITPQHLYFSSQSALVIYPPSDQLVRNQQWDTPHSTAQSQHCLIPQELRSTEEHSTFYILQDASLLPSRVPPMLEPHSTAIRAASPFSCGATHKGWDKEKRADGSTLQSYQGRGESNPCCGVLWTGRGEAAPDWEGQATLLQLAEAALRPHLEQRKGITELSLNKCPQSTFRGRKELSPYCYLY